MREGAEKLAGPLLEYADNAAGNELRGLRLLPAYGMGTLVGGVGMIPLVLREALRDRAHFHSLVCLVVLLFVFVIFISLAACTVFAACLWFRLRIMHRVTYRGGVVAFCAGLLGGLVSGIGTGVGLLLAGLAVGAIYTLFADWFLLRSWGDEPPSIQLRSYARRSAIRLFAATVILFGLGLISSAVSRQACERDVTTTSSMLFRGTTIDIQTQMELPFVVTVDFDARGMEGHTVHFLCFFGWRTAFWDELRWIAEIGNEPIGTADLAESG